MVGTVGAGFVGRTREDDRHCTPHRPARTGGRSGRTAPDAGHPQGDLLDIRVEDGRLVLAEDRARVRVLRARRQPASRCTRSTSARTASREHQRLRLTRVAPRRRRGASTRRGRGLTAAAASRAEDSRREVRRAAACIDGIVVDGRVRLGRATNTITCSPRGGVGSDVATTAERAAHHLFVQLGELARDHDRALRTADRRAGRRASPPRGAATRTARP